MSAAEAGGITPYMDIAMREKFMIMRDTLLVFGVQIVFRATMFLRSLNY